MGIFSKIFNFLIIRKEINKIYNPFFDALEKNLKTFSYLSEEIPDEITNVYLKLSSFKKQNYIDICNKYKAYKTVVREHNASIDFVNSVIANFNYEEIINNPRIYLNKQKNCRNAFDILNKMLLTDPKIIEFYSCVNHLEDNINVIISQFELIDSYNKIFDFSCFDFIDNRTRKNIEKALQPISEFLAKCSVKYYDFSKIEHFGALIEAHNKEFISGEINKPLFSDINGKSLDYEQRIAATRNEDASLVIAGAGSGKTLTICGKVKYLLNELRVNPNDILLLSYSKKSADDLEKKVKTLPAKPGTSGTGSPVTAILKMLL